MFHTNCKRMLQLNQEQPAHSCLVNHCANFSMHFFQKSPYRPNKQESSIPTATMDSPGNEYANPGSCAAQTPMQKEDRKRNVEDVLKEMVFSFEQLVVDWLRGNQDH